MGWFSSSKRQKSEIELLIEKNGINAVAYSITHRMMDFLYDAQIAYEFLIEEMDAARNGTPKAKNFVANCGIKPEEYLNTLYRDNPRIDAEGGPQQFLTAITSPLKSNIDLMVDLRLKIMDLIMLVYKIGKHKHSTQPQIQKYEKLKSIIYSDPLIADAILDVAVGNTSFGLNKLDFDIQKLNECIDSINEISVLTGISGASLVAEILEHKSDGLIRLQILIASQQ